jgi:peptidoglycan/LPS O-acetylase OafA/YrhL
MSLALWVVWVARLGGVNYHLAVLAAFAVYLSVAIIAASMFHRFIDQPCIKLASWAANPKKARAVSSRTAELPQTV